MKNWGNWSYSDLKEVIEKAKEAKQTSVTLSQEHTDWENDQQVAVWLTEIGVNFKTEMERTIVYL